MGKIDHRYKNFLISDNKGKIQLNRVCELLSSSYWAKDRKRETIKKSIENSICFGVYTDEKQIGFARCVTDYATMYWLADVIIDEEYRGLGIGKKLVEAIISHEQLKSLFGLLGTSDAHGLYEKYNFHICNDRFMKRSAKQTTSL